MAKRWIAGAIKHPGALHRSLGVPEGRKIPQAKIAKAAKAGGTLGKRARLAETLKAFHHGGEATGPRKPSRTSGAGYRERAKG